MRVVAKRVLPAVLLLAACASGPKARELQYAEGIKAAQRSTITATEYGIISPEDAETIQAAIRVLTGDLKRAIEARRAGQPQASRLLDAVDDALAQLLRLMREKGAGK